MALRLIISVIDRPSPPDPGGWHSVMEIDLACPGVDSGDVTVLATRLAQIAVTDLGEPRGIARTANVANVVATPAGSSSRGR